MEGSTPMCRVPTPPKRPLPRLPLNLWFLLGLILLGNCVDLYCRSLRWVEATPYAVFVMTVQAILCVVLAGLVVAFARADWKSRRAGKHPTGTTSARAA
jgi:hypothetical protein